MALLIGWRRVRFGIYPRGLLREALALALDPRLRSSVLASAVLLLCCSVSMAVDAVPSGYPSGAAAGVLQIHWFVDHGEIGVALVETADLSDAIDEYHRQFGSLPLRLADLLVVPGTATNAKPILARIPRISIAPHRGRSPKALPQPLAQVGTPHLGFSVGPDGCRCELGVPRKSDASEWLYLPGTLAGGDPAYALLVPCNHPCLAIGSTTYAFSDIVSIGKVKRDGRWEVCEGQAILDALGEKSGLAGLLMEVRAIRNAVRVFRSSNGRNPSSLAEMTPKLIPPV